MILVLADDFSGAAELAGIAASSGLRSEVHLELDPASTADVITIDAESRQLTPDEAQSKTKTALKTVLEHKQPDWIYKKTDSVLRGHVRGEVEAMMDALGVSKALLIPANPGQGRLIHDGRLFIGGKPLHETHFSLDPDHPRRSSDVFELLGISGRRPVIHAAGGESISHTGIIVPDIRSPEELASRVQSIDPDCLPAGGGEFFSALLHERTKRTLETSRRFQRNINSGISGRSLIVCGSLAAWMRNAGQSTSASGIETFICSNDRFLERAQDALFRRGAAMIAIGGEAGGNSERLLKELITGARDLLKKTKIDNVFLEGGATAFAFVQAMGWRRFQCEHAHWAGVGALRPAHDAKDAPLLLVKPGSFAWPESLWTQLCPKAVL